MSIVERPIVVEGEKLERSSSSFPAVCEGDVEVDGDREEILSPDEITIKALVHDVIEQQLEYLRPSMKPTDELAGTDASAAAAAVSDEGDYEVNHLVELSPPSSTAFTRINNKAPLPEQKQTQENIIAAPEPTGDNSATTSPAEVLISYRETEEKEEEEEQQQQKWHNAHNLNDVDNKKTRKGSIQESPHVKQGQVNHPRINHIQEENKNHSVKATEEPDISEKRSAVDEETHDSVAEQLKPMESLLISPESGTPRKLGDEHFHTNSNTSDKLTDAERDEDEEFREAERRAELELDSELVIHDSEPTLVANENANDDKHSQNEVSNEVRPDNVPSTDESSPKKETGKATGIVKPTSRLVRPQTRLIHSSPQSGGVPPRTQSATRPSSAMPKPTATVRSLRPPAPRPVTKCSSKEQLNKKQPGSRTQSQPRPPNMEMKTVSQPTTPKVYRKVVAVSSKIGSFTDHKPSGGNVQIFSETRTYKVQPKVGSLNNVTHTPGGGNVRIPTMKLDFKEKAKPKIDAKSEYVPPVPEKKVISQKLVWNAQSKVGSLDNVKHKPAGGNVQIFDERIQYVSSTNYKSNSSSMNNVNNRSRTTSRTHIDLLDL